MSGRSGRKKIVPLPSRTLSCAGDGAESYPSPNGAESGWFPGGQYMEQKVEVEATPTKKQALTFITTTGTQAESRDEKTRKIVRSHVMKKHHAHLRTTKGYNKKDAQTDIVLKPKTPLGAGRIDPFATYPRQVFDTEHQLIDFYITHFSPLIDAVQQPEFTDASSTIWFPAAIKEPMMFEAMLLIGARGMKTLTQDPSLDKKALMYRARTIRLLNDALSDPRKATSDGAIAALLCLSFDEYNHGNFEAYDQYASAMWRLVQMRGGLDQLGLQGFLAEMIRSNDLACAYYRASTPYYDHKAKPRETTSINALTAGFLAQEILSNLSEDMIGILNDLCAISEALTNSPIGVLPATGPNSYKTLMGSQNTLLILCVGRKTPMFLLEHPDIEECVCLATEVYRARILCGYPALVGALGGDSFIGNDMHESITRILLSDYRHECLELVFWVAFVGTLTTSEESGGAERWVDVILGIAAELHVYCWEDAKRVLGRFLWYERRCDDLWGKIWMKGEQKTSGTE